jgi:proline racemase
MASLGFFLSLPLCGTADLDSRILQVHRSSTGTGLSARAALLHLKGQLNCDEDITAESIVGTR